MIVKFFRLLSVFFILVFIPVYATADLNVPISIPQRTITVDGSADDWAGIDPIVQDSENDSICGKGADIDYVFLAKDAEFLYWRFEVFAHPPIIDGIKYQPGIRVLQKGPMSSDRVAGDIEAKIDYQDDTIIGFVERFNPDTYKWDNLIEDEAYGAAELGGTIEGKIPLSLFDGGTFTYIGAGVHNGVEGGSSCDDAELMSSSTINPDGGYFVTSELWTKAVLEVSGNPVTLVWKEVGSDTTPSGDWVISGYFYADPDDFAYGNEYNPELFVKVYIASNGWCNIAFNHVTVDDVSIYSMSGGESQSSTVSLSQRLVEHQYNGVTIDDNLQTVGEAQANSHSDSYPLNSGLLARAVLQPTTGMVNLIWKEVGSDTTPSGDRVVSGYFYASPEDFPYGSPYNPEVFVKVYIAANGWTNIAFNHVTVDDVILYSEHNYDGSEDKSGSVSLDERLAEHEYLNVIIDEFKETEVVSKIIDQSGGKIVFENQNSEINKCYVDISPDALNEATTISINTLYSYTSYNGEKVENIVSLKPDGIIFNNPIEIGIPFNPSNFDETTSVHYYNNAESTWEPLPTVRIDIENNLIIAQTNHFSEFVVKNNKVKLDIEMYQNDNNISAAIKMVTPLKNIPTTDWYYWAKGIYNIRDMIEYDPLYVDAVFKVVLMKKINFWEDEKIGEKEITYSIYRHVNNNYKPYAVEAFVDNNDEAKIKGKDTNFEGVEDFYSGEPILFSFDYPNEKSKDDDEYYVKVYLDYVWTNRISEGLYFSNCNGKDKCEALSFTDMTTASDEDHDDIIDSYDTSEEDPGIDDGGVAWYYFDDSTCVDISNGFNGEENGYVDYEGGALQLDGKSYVEVEEDESFNLKIFTIMAWVKPDWNKNKTESGFILSHGESSADKIQYSLLVNLTEEGNRHFRSWYESSNDSDYRLNYEIEDSGDKWYFIAATRDNSGSYKLFVKEEQLEDEIYNDSFNYVDSLDNTPEPASVNHPFQIGVRTRDGSRLQNFYTGLIDDVRIYNTALTKEDLELFYLVGRW